MSTFALVHGGLMGAWCWERLSPFLQQAGHDVVAMDLPIEDGSASFDTYADAVCAALGGCDDDVVVVGHSMAGPTIPLVAARRPVQHLVYLCALVPEIGRSLADQIVGEADMLNPVYLTGLSEPDEQSRRVWVDRDVARAMFFSDCDEPTVEAAVNRLRPQGSYPLIDPFTLAEFPSVSCTYVVCNEDQIVRPAWSRRIARDRLGAAVVELSAGHSPFLSRPKALADLLLRLVGEKTTG